MNYNIEYELEEDGRWFAEVPTLPGVMAYRITADEAMTKAEALALRVLAERLEMAECRPMPISIAYQAKAVCSWEVNADGISAES